MTEQQPAGAASVLGRILMRVTRQPAPAAQSTPGDGQWPGYPVDEYI